MSRSDDQQRGARPNKRVLVRWSDDLDKQVLLVVQYVCNEAGLRIPWEDVADMMGEKFTAGAIVQHLAKLRQRMSAVGIDVPPPLRRGVVNNAPSKIYAPVPTTKRKLSLGDGSDAAGSARRTKKAKVKAKVSLSEDDSDDFSAYGCGKKGKKGADLTKKRRMSGTKTGPKKMHVDSDDEGVSDSNILQSDSEPHTKKPKSQDQRLVGTVKGRNRRVSGRKLRDANPRIDYAKLNAGEGDEYDDENEVSEAAEEGEEELELEIENEYPEVDEDEERQNEDDGEDSEDEQPKNSTTTDEEGDMLKQADHGDGSISPRTKLPSKIVPQPLNLSRTGFNPSVPTTIVPGQPGAFHGTTPSQSPYVYPGQAVGVSGQYEQPRSNMSSFSIARTDSLPSMQSPLPLPTGPQAQLPDPGETTSFYHTTEPWPSEASLFSNLFLDAVESNDAYGNHEYGDI